MRQNQIYFLVFFNQKPKTIKLDLKLVSFQSLITLRD